MNFTSLEIRPFAPCLLLALAAALAGCPQSTQPVKGVVSSAVPVEGATITVEDTDMVLMDSATLTGPDGAWQGLLVTSGPQPFRVVVTPATADPRDMGELSAYVQWLDDDPSTPGWHPDREIVVTPLTTFVDRLMSSRDVSYAYACELTAKLFAIPEDIDLTDPEAVAQHFSAQQLTVNSLSHGGLEPYMAHLLEQAGTDARHVVLPINDGITVEVARIGLARFGAEQVLGGIGGAIGSGILKEAMGHLLPLVGIETFENEVRNQLNAIHNKLDVMQRDLTAISDDVHALQARLDVVYDSLVDQYARGKMDDYAATIDEQYMYLMGRYRPGMTGGDFNTAAKFARDLRLVHDIPGCIYKIKTGLCGPPTSSTGALQAYTNLLLTQIAQSDDKTATMVMSYNALQGFFKDMVGIQAKGAVLVTNMLNFEEEYGASKSYYGTAEDFLDTYMAAYLEEEVDTFLGCVEQLVAATADVRSTFAQMQYCYMFPYQASEVLRSADFVAYRLSEKHRQPFVVRFIGDPTIGYKFVDLEPRFLTDAFHPDDRQPVDMLESMAHSLIEQNGAAERQWPATLPDHYTKDYYLGWTRPSGKGWQFTRQRTIYFAKVGFPDGFKNTPDTGVHRFIQYFTNYEDRFELEYLDESGAPGASPSQSVHWGHATIDCRTLPRFIASDSHEKGKSSHKWGYAEMTDTYRGELYSRCELQDDYGTSTAKYDRTLQLKAELENATRAKEELELRYAIESDVSTYQFHEARMTEGLYGSWYQSRSGHYHLGYKLDWLVDSDVKATKQKWNWDRDAIVFTGADWYKNTATHTGTAKASWANSEMRNVVLRVDSNYVSAKVEWSLSRGSDKGSSVAFDHTLDELELIPR